VAERIKTALVTGGTDGIGKEVARGFARNGHRVLIVGRDEIKGLSCEKEIQTTTGNVEVQYIRADLSLMQNAVRLAEQVGKIAPGLHFLVHSAGIVRGRRTVTAEGLESNFAVNYLSRFVLTTRLLPQLEATSESGTKARILIISGAAQGGSIHFDDINLARRFSTLRMVMQCCRANDVFTREMAGRLSATIPVKVTINCLKIGVVKTNIRGEFPRWMKLLVPLLLDPLLGQTPEEAAAPALKLLLDGEFEGLNGGLFLKIKKFRQIKGHAGIPEQQTGPRLFALSEELVAQAIKNRVLANGSE
jgi:NAD(P)-dependent dehydrogenase (short-subunit alcohol dehydrogenase family)